MSLPKIPLHVRVAIEVHGPDELTNEQDERVRTAFMSLGVALAKLVESLATENGFELTGIQTEIG